ncbi:MAG: DUF2357 domain-containing protein [Actinobacteria bacterium]|nr:DUF2357 domain-containing protein [Actinomycetota bacterium]
MKITKKGSGQELEPRHDDPRGLYYRVTENCPYVIELAEGEELKHPAAVRIKPGIYELNFQNFVGWSWVGGRLFKVTSPKITPEIFDAMLEQINGECAALPFAFNTPSFLPFERIAPGGEAVLYHAFMYLRHVLLGADPSLESMVERVIAYPHRVMAQVQERRELHRARRIRPAAVNLLAARPHDLMPVGNAPHLARYEITRRLKDVTGERFFPTHVQCILKELTLDNPENRFVKYFMNVCLGIADLFRRRFEGMVDASSALDYDLVGDSRRMVEILRRILSRRFFAEIGEMRYLPYNSQTLQKRAGYRELFGCFNRMNLGSAYPVTADDLVKIIENKDIATLYEYWTYFACLRCLKEVLGEPVSAHVASTEREARLAHGMCVRFANGAALFYNKTYRYGRDDGSYSLPYRPDVSLETPKGIYIFDAKFKVEDIYAQLREEVLAGNGEEVAQVEERSSKDEEERFSQFFKYGDIHKMHCYRDAIRGVKAAFILYPGHQFRFYHRILGKASSLEDLSDFDGVGALPLRPSAEGMEKYEGKGLLVKLLGKIFEPA